MGRFDALQDEDESEDEEELDLPTQNTEELRTQHHEGTRKEASSSQHVIIPPYEDLSLSRADEETVLTAVYGEDFRREEGPWGHPLLSVHVRPPDIEREQVGSELILAVQVGKQYPYVVPTIGFRDVKGLSRQNQEELHEKLIEAATKCTRNGSVMMLELVQATEDFLALHNRDPNMSAWEEMKAREALEQQEEERRRVEDEAELKNLVAERIQDDSFEGQNANMLASESELKRELARQVQAIAKGTRRRRAKSVGEDELNNNRSTPIDAVDEEDLFESDQEDTNIGGSSRYKTDFIELGLLGRGGGGEVVKCRNRLDRRLYAIKKIILESERGRFGKFGVAQNRKLGREVTTISRMTHKNIVRYYQAWVEEGEVDEYDKEEHLDERQGLKRQEDERVDSGSSDSSRNGESWWTNSPIEHSLASRPQAQNTGLEKKEVVSRASEISWDDESETSDPMLDRRRHTLHPSSVDSMLEAELGHGFQSPLMVGGGTGIHDDLYGGLFANRKSSTTESTEGGDEEARSEVWDESSVKVDPAQNQRLLYIQMEYCSTTLRKLIDESTTRPLEHSERWRLIRQILEGLVYIHGQGIIHRDLKPGNVFLDAERNIRIGDFGLATTHGNQDSKPSTGEPSVDKEGKDNTAQHGQADHIDSALTSRTEGMTGGVGTTFYRAPEQEASSRKEESKYDVSADIFSLGVVIFEMWHPPFDTYMERAEILNTLRGESSLQKLEAKFRKPPSRKRLLLSKQPSSMDWDDGLETLAADRFPPGFVDTTPRNAQQMILLCLELDPTKRPSAADLLASDLLPRKIELEQHYLEEALQILAIPQSESHQQLVDAMFSHPTPDLIEMTYDTDVAAKANNLGSVRVESGQERRAVSPSEAIMRAINEIRSTSAVDVNSLRSVAMSNSSLLSAAGALRRAKYVGKIGKAGRGLLKRASQRVAGILAMNAATSAAVSGVSDGVHGADPRVVESICKRIKGIFESHGAVPLSSPLLRPRHGPSLKGTVGGPAEVLNSRGTTLVLPEDLTAPFARAVGRGGSAANNLKRYEIGRVYHKALAGGHPRESLEASFDICYEDNSVPSCLLEAESLLVVSQVMRTCSSAHNSEPLEASQKGNQVEAGSHPPWYVRLTHTRLADAILELCAVPPKESLRRLCLQLFTKLAAPSITDIVDSFMMPKQQQKARRVVFNRNGEANSEMLEEYLKSLTGDHELPLEAALRLRTFMLDGCCPLPHRFEEALESIQSAAKGVRALDATRKVDPRRLKRYEDISRSIKSLRSFGETLGEIGIRSRLDDDGTAASSELNHPLFLCLDLGLRQRRRHFNGHLLYQVYVLPDLALLEKVQERGEVVGSRVAEGGRYDDLVRRFRPPGNFGSALFNFYTNATIPTCVGVRFTISKLVELVYADAGIALNKIVVGEKWATTDFNQGAASDTRGMDIVRKSLGHPLRFTSTVRCLVASNHGLDSDSAPERLMVASRLWASGISAEYLPQSGVVISLLKQSRHTADALGTHASDWSLDELCGVCAIMKIPFVVIVQSHLLRDKQAVRLRTVVFDSLTNAGGNEIFVRLDDLASAISSSASDGDGVQSVASDCHHDTHPFQSSTNREATNIECVFVDHDQYFSNDKQVSKSDTPQWKSVLKALKALTQRTEEYLTSIQSPSANSVVTPVFAVQLPFFVLRDFGTALMRREEPTATGASSETAEKYPKHKKQLKTLAMAIDNAMKRNGYWSTNNKQGPKKKLLTLLLFSKSEDRFDLVSVGDYDASHDQSGDSGGYGNTPARSGRKGRRNHGHD